jgi:hypothetical protein
MSAVLRRSAALFRPSIEALADLAVRSRGKKWRIALLTLAVFAALC